MTYCYRSFNCCHECGPWTEIHLLLDRPWPQYGSTKDSPCVVVILLVIIVCLSCGATGRCQWTRSTSSLYPEDDLTCDGSDGNTQMQSHECCTAAEAPDSIPAEYPSWRRVGAMDFMISKSSIAIRKSTMSSSISDADRSVLRRVDSS